MLAAERRSPVVCTMASIVLRREDEWTKALHETIAELLSMAEPGHADALTTWFGPPAAVAALYPPPPA
jgi:hypothetical protein